MPNVSAVMVIGLSELARLLLELPDEPAPVLIMTRRSWAELRKAWSAAMKMADASHPASESPEAMMKKAGIAVFLADGDAQLDHCLEDVISTTPENPIIRVR